MEKAAKSGVTGEILGQTLGSPCCFQWAQMNSTGFISAALRGQELLMNPAPEVEKLTAARATGKDGSLRRFRCAAD